MELIWQQVINKLKVNTEDHPLLLTESPLNPKRHREQCAQIFFETFNTPAMYLSIQAILALYSSGRTTGVVMDSGDGVTHVVPVYNGFSLPGSIKRMDIAGRDITEQLQLLLQKNGILLQTSAEKEIVREIKEKYCYISSYSMNEQVEEQSYRLPDGQVIRVGNERHRATEILFRPELIGSESVAIHSLIYDSIQKVDIDLRPSLYQSIVLSGGTTMIRGFGDRLITELKELTTKGTKIKIYAPPERKYSVWIGGSILAGLSTFKKMWVSKEEWEENPEIIHSKCL
jgi:centractin